MATETQPTEKESPFELKRKDDPHQLAAIRLREYVCDDPELSDGAVRLFVRLLDMALNPFLNGGRRGRIVVSQLALSTMLHCDERSIRRRTDELIRTNYIWTNLVPRPNTKPILAYHFTEFVGKPQVREELPGDGVWGNGRRRYDHGFAKTGKEATGQQRRLGSVLFDRFGRQIFFNYLENTPASGQNCPLTPDNSDRSQRTPASSASGQNCPVTPDTSVRSQRSELSAPSGQNRPVTKDASVRHIESPVGGRVIKGDKEGPNGPPVDAFAASIKGEFRSRLEKMRRDLEQKARNANSAKARAEWRRRLKLVEAEILGGDVPDEEAPQPKPVRRPATPERQMTEAEMLESARSAVQLGATLTEGQKQSLIRAGELPKALWKEVGK